MRIRARALLLAFAAPALLLAPVSGALDAQAASPARPARPARPAKVGAASKAPAPAKPHDPSNTTAISQSLDTLVAGNARYAEKDYMGAIDLYRKGISLNPRNPLGPYLLGEAQLASGNLAEAEAAFRQAEDISDSKNPALRSRILFAVADVLERQRKLVEAEAAWRGYLEHLPKSPDAGAYPDTARARIDVIVKMRELTAAYEAVRARIK